MRGTWVGALCSWCHCLSSRGEPYRYKRCDTTTSANISDGRSGYCAPPASRQLREPSTEKRKKREEKEGAHHRKTSPTPLPRELERDARGLEKTVRARLGYEALWPAGTLAFGQWHRIVSADTEPLDELF